MDTPKPRFHYHAHAVALAGEITHPFTERIEEQAPSAVSPFGGFGAVTADRYELRSVVVHCGARSATEGAYNAKTEEHYAVAGTALEGFNLFDIVTVEYLTAKVTAIHSEREEEPRISPHGSTIRNLRIAGHLIELEPLCGLFHSLDTFTKVRDEYKKDNTAFRDDFNRDTRLGAAAELPEKVHKFFPWRNHKSTEPKKLPEFRGRTVVPLFRVKDPRVPGIEVYGNVIHVHNFGRVQVGEMVISPEERRVVMLHVDMGSPQAGSLFAGSSCGGTGQTDPPL